MKISVVKLLPVVLSYIRNTDIKVCKGWFDETQLFIILRFIHNYLNHTKYVHQNENIYVD